MLSNDVMKLIHKFISFLKQILIWCNYMFLLPLSGTPQSLVNSLRNYCNLSLAEKLHKRFPDGEQYIRITSDMRNKIIIVVQSLYPEQDSKLVELYLALEALEGLNLTDVELVIPYMAYSRQDKRFLAGEPMSVKAVYMPLRLFNLRKILALDLHSPKIPEVIGLAIQNILPHTYMVKKVGIEVDFILAPDKGALHRARILAENIGKPFDYLEKYRDRITGEINVSIRELDVKNLRIAIVDDIVSTGGTLAKAAQILYDLGASKVYAVVTHALISEKTIQTLSASGLDMLITTNSILHPEALPKWIQVTDVGELLCSELKSL
jgi:ribose-phosphate pyrophosphokinase